MERIYSLLEDGYDETSMNAYYPYYRFGKEENEIKK